MQQTASLKGWDNVDLVVIGGDFQVFPFFAFLDTALGTYDLEEKYSDSTI